MEDFLPQNLALQWIMMGATITKIQRTTKLQGDFFLHVHHLIEQSRERDQDPENNWAAG